MRKIKPNEPNDRNRDKSVPFLNSVLNLNIWQLNDLEKRRNQNVRISDTYCIEINDCSKRPKSELSDLGIFENGSVVKQFSFQTFGWLFGLIKKSQTKQTSLD